MYSPAAWSVAAGLQELQLGLAGQSVPLFPDLAEIGGSIKGKFPSREPFVAASMAMTDTDTVNKRLSKGY